MSDQKIAEFRERAESAVGPADPDLLLRRGRALRRRRQLAPVAVAACAAVGIAFLASSGGEARTDQQPSDQHSEAPVRTVPAPRFLGDSDDAVPPGTYVLDLLNPEGRPDATVELVGHGWHAWRAGAALGDAQGTVSWGLDEYTGVQVDRCAPDGPVLEPGLISSQVARRVARVEGTRVTVPAAPATAMGLTGTHLQVSVPWLRVNCATGPVEESVLMASWEGPTDPTVTVDVWVLEYGDRLMMLTKGVRGNPSPAQLEALNSSLDTLRMEPPR